MKKGLFLLLSLCALSLCFVLGIFVGRNFNDHYQTLSHNPAVEETSATEPVAEYLLDINKASKAQLMSLPGIGDTIATRIVDYRTENGNFQSVDDLLNVEGIGEKKLLEIENLITAGG